MRTHLADNKVMRGANERIAVRRLQFGSACVIALVLLAGCSANSLLSKLQQTNGATTPPNLTTPAPTFNPSAGIYFTAQNVTLSDTDTSAAIYYTTDGSTPTTSSNLYGNTPISASVNAASITIKSIAVDPNLSPSTVTSATFSALQLAQGKQTNGASSSSNPNVDSAEFASGAVDSSGNVYGAGYISFSPTTSKITFGGNATAYSSTTGGGGPILVKYDSSLSAQCDSPEIIGSSKFFSVALDSSGNAFAVGNITGTSSYNFGGSSGSVTGGSSNSNAVLVKYNSSCQTQWAVSTLGATTYTSASAPSNFFGVSVDLSIGYVYAAGNINGSVFFGNGISATGAKGGVNNAVVVAYDGAGTAQWASSPVTATSGSSFDSSGEDSSGNVYVGGDLATGTFGFGNGVTVTTTKQSGVVVKYNSSGTALWADVFPYPNEVTALAIGSSGNIYVPGSGVIIEISPSGKVLSNPQPLSGVSFTGITLDSSGNIYAAGTMTGTNTVDFGNGVYASGVYSSANDLLVKYSSSGVAQWAQTLAKGSNSSFFASVGVDTSGNAYAIGSILGSSLFDFGNNQTLTGSPSIGLWSVAVVKYKG